MCGPVGKRHKKRSKQKAPWPTHSPPRSSYICLTFYSGDGAGRLDNLLTTFSTFPQLPAQSLLIFTAIKLLIIYVSKC